jgi:hypothetical protein
VNRQWHAEHRLPHDANLEERMDWHVAHAQACGCRPIPPEIAQAIKDRRISKPD